MEVAVAEPKLKFYKIYEAYEACRQGEIVVSHSDEQKVLHVYLYLLYFNIFYKPEIHRRPSFAISDLRKMVVDGTLSNLDPYVRNYFQSYAYGDPNLEDLDIILARHRVKDVVSDHIIKTVFAIYGQDAIDIEDVAVYEPYIDSNGLPMLVYSDMNVDLKLNNLNILKSRNYNHKCYFATCSSGDPMVVLRAIAKTALPIKIGSFTFDTAFIPIQNQVAKLINFYEHLYPAYKKSTGTTTLRYTDSQFIRAALCNYNIYYYDKRSPALAVVGAEYKKDEETLIAAICSLYTKTAVKTLFDLFADYYEGRIYFSACEAINDTIDEKDEPDSTFFDEEEESEEDTSQELNEDSEEDPTFSDDENSETPVEMDNDNIESEQAGGSILTFLSGTDSPKDFLYKLAVLEKCRELTNNPSAISPENLTQFRNWCRLYLFVTVAENTKSLLQQLKIADVKEFEQ